MRIGWKKPWVWAIGLGLGAAYLRASRWRRRLLFRIDRGDWVARTSKGPVEYGLLGSGQPVLVLHGTPGGYDQGMAMARLWAQEGLSFLAVSRPGYLYTPLDIGRTPEEQADAYAALLDSLGIAKVPVVAVSGGGPSGIQFALRHPHRISKLVLLEAVSGTLRAPKPGLMVRLLEFNLAAWLFLRLAWIWQKAFSSNPIFTRMPDILVTGLESMLPLDLRREGLANDVEQMGMLGVLSLDAIKVPTLIVHGKKDTVVPYALSEAAAQAIPGAEFLSLPEGNHLSTPLDPAAVEAIRAFLTPMRGPVTVITEAVAFSPSVDAPS